MLDSGDTEISDQSADVADAQPAASALAPLRDARFRVAWFAFLAAQVVIWAQTVGAVDVITRESGSAALVALIQTAISVPGVVLSLFAGAVADVVDRRRLLVAATLAMAVSMAVLAALTVTDVGDAGDRARPHGGAGRRAGDVPAGVLGDGARPRAAAACSRPRSP